MGTYIPPTGTPLAQQFAQPYNLAWVFNDPLLQTINYADGTPGFYIRGTSTHCRVVRISDGQELIDVGSIAAATAFIQDFLVIDGQFGDFAFGLSPFGGSP